MSIWELARRLASDSRYGHAISAMDSVTGGVTLIEDTAYEAAVCEYSRWQESGVLLKTLAVVQGKYTDSYPWGCIEV